MPTLADRISRKWALTVAVVIFNIGAIMQTAAPNYGVLMAGRTIGGLGVGTLAMGAPIYISELSPPNLRGTLLVLESICIVSGAVISFYITHATRHISGEASFGLPFGLQMVSATILGVGIHFFSFLLGGLPSYDERKDPEYNGILTEIAVGKSMREKNHTGVSGVKLKTLAVSGVNGFIYYAPTLFASLGQDPETALTMSGIFNILQLVGVVLCFVVIDHVDRRPLTIYGAICGAITWGLTAVLSDLYSHDWQTNPAAGWAAVAMDFLFILVFGLSYSRLGWILPAEVYTATSGAKGVALATCVTWISNFIVGVATLPMLDSIDFGMYVFYGSFCAMAAVWAFFLVPGTKGKTLEEMDFVFKDTAA
ncbi:substrate transporter [Paramyrothecium foliicola]|nr:substrate transporter [Paramyrothecium foliicola]